MAPAPAPKPSSLRLVSKAPSPRATPPLGVGKWSTAEAEGVVVVLVPAAGDRAPTLEETVAQLPPPNAVLPGALVVVMAETETGRGVLGRLLAGKTEVPRRVRCGALLVAGYERIGGGNDPKAGGDLAWGYAPAR